MNRDREASFSQTFFAAGGQHPNAEEAVRHFESAFVSPPNFEELVEAIRPRAGEKRVVVVDGHPRSGKTWCVTKAVERLIEQERLSPEEWWTPGIDSLSVLPTTADNLFGAARAVEAHLRGNPALKIVLLDDFLGTNHLRPVGENVADQSVRPYFTWDEANPWLQALSEGTTLLLTARSLHLTLAEILLGVNLRGQEREDSNIVVTNFRRGFFRTFESGEPFGAFDAATLERVAAKNRESHPLRRSEEADWLIIAAPLLAFAEDAQHRLTDLQKEYAARTLFGEDIESLAETIEKALEFRPADEDSSRWRGRTLPQLFRTYLVAVAPGLLFLDKTAYEALSIDTQVRNIVERGLYLTETIDEFCSGRLPNEFYMIAVNEHLTHNLSFAARVFARVVNPERRGFKGVEEVKGYALGLRGLLERGLHKRETGALAQLLGVREFRHLVDSYLKLKNDCLVHLELDEGFLRNDCRVLLTPGLAAAIGWVLKNFFYETEESRRNGLGEKVRRTVTEWFPARFNFLLKEFEKLKTETEPANRPLLPVPNLDTDLDSRWVVVATYSTFLQWVIRMDERPEEGGLLDEIIKVCDESAEVVRRQLRIVLEDELIWALSEGMFELHRLPKVRRALGFVDEEASDVKAWDEEGKQLRVNRLFSLAWHNKEAGGPVDFGRRAGAWLERFRRSTLECLKGQPELLDDNLQYHWCHFITQRAVWMRDWCFQNDPNEFERGYSQIAEGSRDPKDNQLLADIAAAVIDEDRVGNERIRNMLLLVGTRASRMPDLHLITRKIDAVIDGEGPAARHAREHVLQAIFELGRQGFLDDRSENTTADFREWCRKKLADYRDDLDAAWTFYWESLDFMTHLDIRPRKKHGWKDVLPPSAAQQLASSTAGS